MICSIRDKRESARLSLATRRGRVAIGTNLVGLLGEARKAQRSLGPERADVSQLFLILCGSSLSFMKEQIFNEKSPLYGRRTAQLEVRPFDFFESLPFLHGMGLQQAAEAYGMIGGIPLYLLQFDGDETLARNVEASFLDPSSILYEEPVNLLKQEIQKASQYNAMLAAIAGGASQNNQIATAVGLSSAEITYYLKELQRLEPVRREVPILGGGRRATYRISDNLFRFWYRFVMPHRPTVERGITARALAAVGSHMSEYMGPAFEEICTQWIWRRYVRGELDFDFDDVGRWWGNDPRAAGGRGRHRVQGRCCGHSHGRMQVALRGLPGRGAREAVGKGLAGEREA